MKLRKLSRIEKGVQVLLSILLAALIYDYFEALRSLPCGPLPLESSQGCYPWGMTEGPMDGGAWNYTDKQMYLKSGVVLCGIIFAAIVSPFLAPGIWSGLAAVVVILVLGSRNAQWLTGLL